MDCEDVMTFPDGDMSEEHSAGRELFQQLEHTSTHISIFPSRNKTSTSLKKKKPKLSWLYLVSLKCIRNISAERVNLQSQAPAWQTLGHPGNPSCAEAGE